MKLMRGPGFDEHRIAVPDILKSMNPDARDDENNGAFVIKRGIVELRVIASNGGGWDHVSIHAVVGSKQRCPTWEEMEFIKRRFFKDSEVAMQLHVTPGDHINHNPYVLHIWRPHKTTIPLPPAIYV